jgi:hypothetical protein
MDEIDELASAARQAWRRPQQPKSSSKPIVITVVVVFALLAGFGAIVWLARPTPPAAPAAVPVVVEPEVTTPDIEAAAAEAAKAKAAHVRFNAFTARLAAEMSKAHRTALQAAAPKEAIYNCAYLVKKTVVERPRNARTPRECIATLAGNVDWKDEENNTSADTYKVIATFADTDGTWTIVTATSEVLTHTDSAGLFSDPVKIGATKNLGPIDWFNEAVADAQKPD